jgi:hypothetical protein
MRTGRFRKPSVTDWNPCLKPYPKTEPFQGESMTCALCDRVRKSGPNLSTGWYALDVDGLRLYVCPDHAPTSNCSIEEYNRAWVAILERVVAKETIDYEDDEDLIERLQREEKQEFGE